jgi:hypothetical protein
MDEEEDDGECSVVDVSVVKLELWLGVSFLWEDSILQTVGHILQCLIVVVRILCSHCSMSCSIYQLYKLRSKRP